MRNSGLFQNEFQKQMMLQAIANIATAVGYAKGTVNFRTAMEYLTENNISLPGVTTERLCAMIGQTARGNPGFTIREREVEQNE